MVRVTIEDPKTKDSVDFYMDDKLRRQLDRKVKTALTTRDEDYVVVVDGNERVGKSVFAMQLGKYIDPSLTIDRICFSPDEFREAILGAKKGQCVIFDEAYRGLAAKGALSEMNKILVSLMMEMGQKNLMVIIVLPTIHLIEKYVALWRARGLFHIYRSHGRKGYWRFYNKKKVAPIYLKGKKDYAYTYAKSFFRGRFYNRYVISEDTYRKKKSKSLREGYKTTKQEKFKEQRDQMLYMIHEELQLSQQEISDKFKFYNIPLKRRTIGEILQKNGAIRQMVGENPR